MYEIDHQQARQHPVSTEGFTDTEAASMLSILRPLADELSDVAQAWLADHEIQDFSYRGLGLREIMGVNHIVAAKAVIGSNIMAPQRT